MAAWYIYIIRTGHNTLYTGIATDVKRRLQEHESNRGSKYLRSRGPLQVLYKRKIGSRNLALKVEYRIKQLSRAEKDLIVSKKLSANTLIRRLDLSFESGE